MRINAIITVSIFAIIIFVLIPNEDKYLIPDADQSETVLPISPKIPKYFSETSVIV